MSINVQHLHYQEGFEKYGNKEQAEAFESGVFRGRIYSLSLIKRLLETRLAVARMELDELDPEPEGTPEPVGRKGPDPDQICWARLIVLDDVIEIVKQEMKNLEVE